MDLLDKFELKGWWQHALTRTQQEQVASAYAPMGSGGSTPFLYQDISGLVHTGSYDICGFLQTLSCVATGEAQKILIEKLEDEVITQFEGSAKNLIDLHLALAFLIKHHYRLRAEKKHYDLAKKMCLLQISISNKVAKKFRHPQKPKELKRLHKLTGIKHPYYDEPQPLPSHTGYKQLAIILEKEGNLAEAVKLSQKAIKQGWADDYEKRLLRLNKKIEKHTRSS